MTDLKKRKFFAEYLELLLEGKCGDAEWAFYVVEHYADEGLEEIRREIVRLRITAGDPKIFPSTVEHREKIKVWLKELC